MDEREHYLQILQMHDDPDRWEYPARFNYDAARNTFLAFANSVQERLKVVCQVETDSFIQDASFIGQIIVPDAVLAHKHDNQPGIIRVSNFGNMATVTEEDIFPAPLLIAIKQSIDEFDYVYIPPTVLAEPYTGRNAGVTGIDTWWIRYFDWV